MRKFKPVTAAAIFCLLILFSGCGLTGTAPAYTVAAGDPLKARRYVLENGLQVYITVNREKPVFYAEIAVRAGSKQDPADATGIAHYLEHMLFKGTGKIGTLDFQKEQQHLNEITRLYEQYFHTKDRAARAAIFRRINAASALAARYAVPNELDRIYARIGATKLNAHTSMEETVYKVEVPANRLATWAKVESERFSNPVFRLFTTELETVYEEKNRALDNKDRFFWKEIMKQIYKNHPYGQQTVLGRTEHLKNPSLKKMYEYFRNYYVPNNMAIFISGDVDPDRAIRIINREFSKLKRRPLPPPGKWPEKPFTGEETVRVNFPAEEEVVLAYRTVPWNHPDRAALKMMDMVLDNSQAGLINLNLKQAQLVKDAGCFPDVNNDYGTQFFFGNPRRGQTMEQVRQLLLQQIEKVKKGEFPDWLPAAVKAEFRKSRMKSREDNVTRVAELRTGFLRGISREKILQSYTEMEKITKADIVRVANKYFGENRILAYRYNRPASIPKLEKPQFEKIKISADRNSAFFQQLFASTPDPVKPVFLDFSRDLTRVQAGPGLELLTVKNPFNTLFSVSFTFDTGRYSDPLLPLLARLIPVSGTAKMTAREIQSRFYRLGCSYTVNAGPRETVVSLEGLHGAFPQAMDLLFSLLTELRPDKTTLQGLKRLVLSERAADKINPETVRRALYYFSRYGKNSPFLRTLSNREVQQVDRASLKRSLSTLLRHRCTVDYFGPATAAELKPLLTKHLPAKPRLKTTAPFFPPAVRYTEDTVHLLPRTMRQAMIYLGLPGSRFNPRHSTASSLYNEYFSGSMGSILFQELREARGLAYAVWAGIQPGDDLRNEDYFTGFIGTQTEKAADAVKRFRELVYNIPLSEQRFAFARSFLINRLQSSRIGYRSRVQTVLQWEQMGFTNTDPRRQSLQELQNARPGLIRQTAQRITSGKKMVISVMGDPARLDLKKLQQFGRIRRLTTDAVFNY